jgi:hypothetical protein
LLLSQTGLWKRFSEASVSLVGEYNFDNAALGFLAACQFAASNIKARESAVPI